MIFLPVAGLLALATPATAADGQFVRISRADSPGNDYQRLENSSLSDCESRCAADTSCNAFTYNDHQSLCFLKLAASPIVSLSAFATTGIKLAPTMRPAGSDRGSGAAIVMLSQADSPGGDISQEDGSSLEECQAKCVKDETCKAFTYNHARATCFLKRAPREWTTFSAWATTGVKLSQQPAAAPSDAPAEQKPQ